jgi:type II secretory pathway pseudopilin PulG
MNTISFKQSCATRKQRAFTLVEAILVAILVGLLASVAIIKSQGARAHAVDVARGDFIQSLNVNIQRAAAQSVPFNGAGKADFSGEEDPSTAAFLALLDDLAGYGYYTQSSYEIARKLLEGELDGSIFVRIALGEEVDTTDLTGVNTWGEIEVKR